MTDDIEPEKESSREPIEEDIELDFLDLGEDTVESLLEDDEITAEEAGFTEGYYAAS
jgi:hypothetical protein